MNIATADARLGDLHPDIVRIFERGYWPIFEDDIFNGTEDEGEVCSLVVKQLSICQSRVMLGYIQSCWLEPSPRKRKH